MDNEHSVISLFFKLHLYRYDILSDNQKRRQKHLKLNTILSYKSVPSVYRILSV